MNLGCAGGIGFRDSDVVVCQQRTTAGEQQPLVGIGAKATAGESYNFV